MLNDVRERERGGGNRGMDQREMNIEMRTMTQRIDRPKNQKGCKRTLSSDSRNG